MPLSWPNEEPVVKIFVFNGADCANYFAPLPMELYNLLQLQCTIVGVYLDVLVCRRSRKRAQSDPGRIGERQKRRLWRSVLPRSMYLRMRKNQTELNDHLSTMSILASGGWDYPKQSLFVDCSFIFIHTKEVMLWNSWISLWASIAYICYDIKYGNWWK